MPMEPGIYDAECTQVREATHAVGVLLVVVGGQRGTGFSLQGAPEVITVMPDVLERTARELRAALGVVAPDDAELVAQHPILQGLAAQGWRLDATAEQIRLRYSDADFAAQVPRDLMYFDIGQLCGQVEQLSRALLALGGKLP